MSETITCKYTCSGCGLDSVDVAVPMRRRDQDVVDWVQNTVGHAIGDDHQQRSPGCLSRVMDQVMIPTPAGAPMIGRPTEH